MKKGSILQEDKTVLHVYVPDNRTSKYERQKLIGWQGELDESTIVGIPESLGSLLHVSGESRLPSPFIPQNQNPCFGAT